MTTRLSSTLRLSALLALLFGTVLTTPTRAAETVVAYRIENHDRQVTVKNGAGKALLTCRAATPTLQAIIDARGITNKSVPPKVSLTLEDQNGLRLWSTPITIPRRLGAKPVQSMNLSFKSSSDVAGTEFSFNFSTDASDAPDHPDSVSMICIIGADGHLVSMKSQDSGGKVYQAVAGPNGMTLTGPDGDNAQVKFNDASGKPGGTIVVNGTTITTTLVKRDGKEYLSFPWNGHQVFVEQGCTFTLNDDGDLMINAPGKAANK